MSRNRHSNGAFRAFLWLLIAAIAVQFFPSPARAEELAKAPAPSPKVPGTEPSPAGSPAGSATPLPKVTNVEGEIKLHNTLTVNCEGLKEWAQMKGNDPAKLILYFEGTQMQGLIPKIDEVSENKVFFRLERVTGENKTDNGKAWDSLFSGSKGIGTIRNVRVTIGPETGAPFDSKQTAPLCAIPTSRFTWWAIAAGVLLLVMGLLGCYSDLLRDSGDQPASGNRKPFSLARCQMALWFVCIALAYLFIFVVTSAIDTITASVLALMGISAGTGLAAVAVDNSKRAQAKTELDKLKTERARLQGQSDLAKAGGPAFAAESAQRLNDLGGLIENQQKLIEPSDSKWFLQDILSDADGISFHRLQIAVWTVVLGIIFWDLVIHILSMPNFSAELLALMGISGGTYIGFKFPEKLN
jgi:hypothetical protein